jgi:hypothetical protein
MSSRGTPSTQDDELNFNFEWGQWLGVVFISTPVVDDPPLLIIKDSRPAHLRPRHDWETRERPKHRRKRR